MLKRKILILLFCLLPIFAYSLKLTIENESLDIDNFHHKTVDIKSIYIILSNGTAICLTTPKLGQTVFRDIQLESNLTVSYIAGRSIDDNNIYIPFFQVLQVKNAANFVIKLGTTNNDSLTIDGSFSSED